MADSIRGDGLYRADRALAALVDNPEQLDRTRDRFNDSPPSYRSHESGTPTRSPSPITLDDAQRLRSAHEWKLRREYHASFPHAQFDAEMRDESVEVEREFLHRIRPVQLGRTFTAVAKEDIKKQWVEQGIWGENWDRTRQWTWKHEKPLEQEPESDSEPEVIPRNLFGPRKSPEPKLKQPKSEEEIRQIAERRVVREREREASRPFYRFNYQVAKERERIQAWATAEPVWARSDGDDVPGFAFSPEIADSPDINTMAYENVMDTWIRRGIWDRKWGILPGMSWKHEQNLEEWLREEMAEYPIPAPESPLGGDDHAAGDTPQRHVRFTFSSGESNHEVPSSSNASHPGPSASINPAESNHEAPTASRQGLFANYNPAAFPQGLLTTVYNPIMSREGVFTNFNPVASHQGLFANVNNPTTSHLGPSTSINPAESNHEAPTTSHQGLFGSTIRAESNHEAPTASHQGLFGSTIRAESNHEAPTTSHQKLFGSPIHSESNHNVPTTSHQKLFGSPIHSESNHNVPTTSHQGLFGSTIRAESNHEAPTTSHQKLFGSPIHSESNHEAPTASHQGLSANINSAEPVDGNAIHADSEPSLRRSITESRHSTPEQRRQRRERQPSPESRQARPATPTSLGPVHASKVSKTRKRKGSRTQRRPSAPEASTSESQPLLPGSDMPDPPTQTKAVPPRRSKRLQEAEASRAAQITTGVRKDLPDGASKPRTRKKAVASNPTPAPSAHSGGVSKRRRSKRHSGK
ncbi:hypothetical protein F5Y12DRAFT_734151 [Xylaria sp. FL1777]|nr:hypothetical protein F5Y12DRAFT_734151 [Xylaria sp. FL1777]